MYLEICFNKRCWLIGHSIISVLPEIDCSGMTVEDVDGLLKHCQGLMQDEFERISSFSTRSIK